MEFEELLDSIDETSYHNLKLAVELGKWPDGRKLDKNQKELCLQAVIAWDAKHKNADQRVGHIDKNNCSSNAAEQEQIVLLKNSTQNNTNH